jgi:secondary thiamine-phosphate synthase enzyme
MDWPVRNQGRVADDSFAAHFGFAPDSGKRRPGCEAFFKRLVPDGDPLFIHTAEGDDDMPAHIRTALTNVNLSVLVRGGQLVLGTWQGIYIWEHRNRGHVRHVVLHLMGE